MPIVSCPHCDSRAVVDPDDDGRRVVCPDCAEPFTARVPARRPRRADGEDDRPPRRRKSSAMNPGAIVGICVGATVVLGGGGLLVAHAIDRKKDPAPARAEFAVGRPAPDRPADGGLLDAVVGSRPEAGGGGLAGVLPPASTKPPGWVTYTSPDGRLTAHFPAAPNDIGVGSTPLPRMALTEFFAGLSYPDRSRGYTVLLGNPATGGRITPDDEQVIRRMILRQLNNDTERVEEERPAVLAGFPGVGGSGVIRPGGWIKEGGRFGYRFAVVRGLARDTFVAATAGGAGVPAADIEAFFDSIRVVP